MQLPLSASTLVPVGVGAVLAGVLLFLVLLATRRRFRSTAVPGAAGLPVTDAIDVQPSSAHVAEPACAHPADAPGGPADEATHVTDSAPTRAPSPGRADPEASTATAPATGPDNAEPPAVRLPNRDETGSSRSVAAAVAQAFAVRAAASRAGVPLPTRGTNGGGPRLRQPGSDGRRDQSGAVAPQPTADPRDGRENGHRVEEQPPAPEPDGTAVAPAASEPERATEPQPVTGDDRRRDTPPVAPPEADPEERPSPAYEVSGAGQAAAAPARLPTGTGTGPAPIDARDRLLAVLLDDPERAVGATEELARSLHALEQLTEAVSHERDVLRDVLRRLVDAGLRPEQLARLAGVSLADLQALLVPARQQAQ